MKRILFLSAMIVFLSIEIFSQAIPKQISYQGVLKDTFGNILTGDISMTFKVYNNPAGGSELWTETQTVSVTNGLFSVHLGSINPITTIPFDRIHFLGVTIGAESELSPRTLLSSSPYSFMSMNVLDNVITTNKIQDGAVTGLKIGSNEIVKSLNGLKDSVNLVAGSNITITPSGNELTISATPGGGGTIGGSGTANYLPLFTEATTLGNSVLYQSGGNIGIGTTTPDAKLELSGNDALINGLTIGRGTGNLFGNSAFGYRALYSNTTGHNNTANGYQVLYSNIEGSGNTANGYASLYSNSTGDYNTAIGYQTLYYNTIETDNTAIGFSAGDNRTFSQSTFLGSNAFPDANGYTNVMGLGYLARPTASNQVRIGNTSISSIGGYAGWTNFSDGRYKLAVNENVKGLDFIMKLRPITYQLDVKTLSAVLKENQRRDENGNIITKSSETDIKSRNEKSQIIYTGFVAQEVESVAKELGFDFSGVDSPKNENDFYGLRYAEFVVPLVKAVQEQQQIIEKLTRRIEELEKK